MMRHTYHPMILLLLLSSIISPFAFAEHTHEKKSWGRELYRELYNVIHEYSYYGNKYNDGSYFPQARAQEILTYIEDTYLKNKPYQTYYSDDNPLQYVASISMAKLLLYYGGDPIGKHPAYIPLNNVVTQSFPHKTIVPDLNHDEILAFIAIDPYDKPWQGHLPSNNAIALAKLYLGLGADIHAPSGTDAALDNSRILISTYGSYGDTVSKYVVPDDKDYANLLITDPSLEDAIFYRSPVTYWLEEFIAAGYPASMLDTHKLYYPRFMKDASVAQVTDMLENPDAHKIPANINCPYK